MAVIALGLMVLAALIQIVFLLRKSSDADPASHFFMIVAAALLVVVTIVRSIQIGFVAITNTYESLVFYSAGIAILVFVYRMQKRWPVYRFVVFGATMIAIVLMALASSPAIPSDVRPPIPALQSAWLMLHVSFSFIGEAFFAISFVAAILSLAAKSDEVRRNADRLVYTTIAVGYPFFTAGALVFGAIWAESAWGSFWSWDPKETWALITWLVYTAYLHTRLVKKLKGRISIILAIVGFLFTLFTFFGVNYLLSGLHSYG